MNAHTDLGSAEDFARRENLSTHDGQFPHAVPTRAVRYSSIESLVAAVNASGSHFFSDGALNFFDTRKPIRLFGGRFFVDRTKVGEDAHGFTVRYVLDNREFQNGENLTVESLSEYGEFTTRKAAEDFAARAAAHYADGTGG